MTWYSRSIKSHRVSQCHLIHLISRLNPLRPIPQKRQTHSQFVGIWQRIVWVGHFVRLALKWVKVCQIQKALCLGATPWSFDQKSILWNISKKISKRISTLLITLHEAVYEFNSQLSLNETQYPAHFQMFSGNIFLKKVIWCVLCKKIKKGKIGG